MDCTVNEYFFLEPRAESSILRFCDCCPMKFNIGGDVCAPEVTSTASGCFLPKMVTILHLFSFFSKTELTLARQRNLDMFLSVHERKITTSRQNCFYKICLWPNLARLITHFLFKVSVHCPWPLLVLLRGNCITQTNISYSSQTFNTHSNGLRKKKHKPNEL